jgi:hypothetical protein
VLAEDVIGVMRREIAGAKTNGLTEVGLDSLSHLVDLIEAQCQREPDNLASQEVGLERFRAELAMWQGDVQRNHDADLEMLRSTIQIGQLALKSALLINGGAAVAFLAFMGTVWSRLTSLSGKVALASAMEWFVWGVLATGVGTAIAYICQASLGGEFGKRGEALGEGLRWVTVIALALSFVFFTLGGLTAVRVFSTSAL